ncbi:hypothetical protein [Sulfolobus islandicus rudivirus 1 variant XX]|uniref:Uncharacterized protein n=2 Tax=Sulfolobus islandicus rod-shaped virus 1 TaxID=157898 RepID=Q5W371_SIRV1|nr:hypothetical protein [Sulfolobus islandicus rod-shaped virus 1]CAG38866.1 hypothetical protein [Sulfolobus islandicus rudivirus 1 variant XX]
MSFYIYDISERKMKKMVQVGNVRYFIESEDDVVSVVHELARKNYSVQQIAGFLGVSVRKVKQYLESC